MDLKNAAEFDRVVTRVLSALADAFPRPIDLHFDDLGLADGPAHVETNDVYNRHVETEHMPQHVFAALCVRFLESEKYVSGTGHSYWATGVLLTAKGLDLIGGPPSSLRITH
ncbi:hypothetical protein [Pseudomonas laurylsulfativorans]|uniref:hypothetical protein n=1 Tax=Pseudomonas laurylsulfativorans TaxID=1943631 RepID=UPI001056E656|nr:hypothetical protein [Pseudomonas laurylsulfativorans]